MRYAILIDKGYFSGDVTEPQFFGFEGWFKKNVMQKK